MVRLLFVDDDERAHSTLALVLPPEYGLISATTVRAAAQLIDAGAADIVLLDIHLPDGSGLDLLARIVDRPLPPPVVILSASAEVRVVVEAMRAGAVDYVVKPFELHTLLATLGTALANHRARATAVAHPADDDAAAGTLLVGESDVMHEVRALVAAYAESDAAVMVTGESGTGKELVARMVHECSYRAAAPFVALNCGAIPDTLVESELFGAEVGAFTGAVARPGCFEQADAGTLLLDEVAEMTPAAQVKLLRVLENKEVTRVGGRKQLPLNVRVVSATNRDPQQYVAAGQLREDLYYRLAVLPIHLPPLRRRADDIPLLAYALLAGSALPTGAGGAPHIEDAALDRLRAHHWPGNVRELRNVLERARLMAARRDPAATSVVITAADITIGAAR